MALMHVEDFNNPSFDYGNWEVMTHDVDSEGNYLLTNNMIGHGQITELTIDLDISTISFDYLVSSESRYDFLTVFIDGSTVVSASGDSRTWNSFSKTYSERKVRRIVFRYSKNGSGSTGYDRGFIRNLTFDKQFFAGYLLDDGGDIKRWDSSSTQWVSTGEAIFTEDIMIQYGVRNFPNSLNGAVATNPTILYWSDRAKEDFPLDYYTKYKAVPQYQVIEQKTDFSIISAIKKVEATVTTSGNGMVKIATSIDGGVTWKVYKNSTWQVVDITDLDSFKTNGNTHTELIAIPTTVWSTFLDGGSLIRFAYILCTEASTDKAEIDMFKLLYN